MDRETRREALAAKFKSSFRSDDITEELKIYSRIMSEVYLWQQADEMMFPHIRYSNNSNSQQKLSS
ncbi:MAG: hypothetical protein HOD43_05360 [Candidatus Marinimicrobia bacterium]|nr:hypothetical protein [Candidatus Neomarinimicrobiota bacterium]MBT3632593.1 hypothetical protein [Candidatus Neomarinimicrobiota bacterium]MBT3824992.1 hypothetical protein [Candidatus Neomarinimicrobiota bacterium]MBT4129152.1 hypothetical protein [Candidatus Neomarinimicrobiota bacterium]MBT4295217.1 hypothetical protein [Candidatus Neomarinimicrobiota bacterium]